MCGLCGVWGGRAHWTGRPQSPDFLTATAVAPPLRDRLQQLGFVNRLIGPFGVTARDWEGVQWIVESVNGGSEIVSDIAALWPAVERLSLRRIDPLSATTLAAFASGRKQ